MNSITSNIQNIDFSLVENNISLFSLNQNIYKNLKKSWSNHNSKQISCDRFHLTMHYSLYVTGSTISEFWSCSLSGSENAWKYPTAIEICTTVHLIQFISCLVGYVMVCILLTINGWSGTVGCSDHTILLKPALHYCSKNSLLRSE